VLIAIFQRLITIFSGLQEINGIAIFSDDDNLNIEEYCGRQKRYYCGNRFLEVDNDLSEDEYVLCVIDANECTIGSVNHNIEVIWSKESYVSRKQDAGGQSEKRFEMNRENELVQWLKKCADQLRLITEDRPIIIGGPGNVKLRLLDYYTPKHQISIQDVGNTNYAGLEELFNKSLDDIKQCKLKAAKIMVDDFSKRLAKNDPLISYGLESLNPKNVEMVIVDRKYASLIPEGIKTIVVEGQHIISALKVGIIKRYVEYT
jgi:peptide subunit release factor 1 (eRF1)